MMALLVILGGPAKGQDQPITYYVQLIRGTDSEKPPAPESKRVGPKLKETFGSVFRWKHYWEMSRREIAVSGGQRKLVNLNKERSVEIDLADSNRTKVTAFRNGKAMDRTVKPRGQGMTLIGGDRDSDSIWFIVVRRDKPKD